MPSGHDEGRAERDEMPSVGGKRREGRRKREGSSKQAFASCWDEAHHCLTSGFRIEILCHGHEATEVDSFAQPARQGKDI